MSFDRKIWLEPAGEKFAVVKTCVYTDATGRQWLIPKGFKTDGASRPRIVAWALPKFGTWTEPAIMHDYHCEIGIRRGYIDAVGADWLFLEMLQTAGVPWLSRWLAWAGVRWGAAANPIRRQAWFTDFWKLAGMSLIGLLVLPIPAAGILVGQVLFGAVQGATSLFLDERTTTGVELKQ